MMGCSKSQNDLLQYLKIELSSAKRFSKSLQREANKKQRYMGVGVQANPPGGALTETASPFPGIPSAGQAGSFGSGSRAPGWLRAEVRSTPPWIPSQLPLEETARYSTEWPANRSSSTWYFPTWSVVLLLKICGDQIGPKCWVFVSPARGKGSLCSSIAQSRIRLDST